MRKQQILNKEIESFDFQSGGEASSNLKNILRKLGVSAQIVRKTAIVTYELEMNVVIHSLGGEITALISEDELEIRVDDDGPGIADLDKAFTAGYSTASDEIREMGFGAGMGLVNVKRYADQIDVKSSLGEGTHVKVIIKLSS
ncbi:ATP-binding protein [Halanaerobium congolense]|uniref:Anti-sigma regulatory factor (Ser/Thr protein kinase) n=1 Tax=Halanaerobium congolense TaxID=54121 RepID=A0A1G6Q0V1_9FIRM|nr:ATP-binding protein [Halanaerobium congolense]KXS49652.1 MAG: putative anti-sigma regulatory factor [Halanaerobium sp. T82-1]OEG62118.1 MAG: anti-sigma regulatory factor [Halanaerobium sp. MDAL1]PUU92853.1 MAG: putative anti-sigma regulatory factor [Halanaerobium sp.]PTX15509.1 anti-sigma regulatory factor (Ser/Thr protein kinase) [Halanaerobium congolense]PXV60210.1 anti-sigma regulatory factor (Ser/Thr protein kinase) [Halanaerobium congolense]